MSRVYVFRSNKSEQEHLEGIGSEVSFLKLSISNANTNAVVGLLVEDFMKVVSEIPGEELPVTEPLGNKAAQAVVLLAMMEDIVYPPTKIVLAADLETGPDY
jgi:hypothetical protein